MNSGNFACELKKNTTQISDMIEFDKPEYVLAAVALTSCAYPVNVDEIFDELKNLDGFKVLLSLLDYKTALDINEFIDMDEAYEIAEPYVENRAHGKQIRKVIYNVIKLIRDIRRILRNAEEIPAVLKINNFNFYFLYFLALAREELDPENILSNAVEFERLILIHSNDLSNDIKEIKGLKNERVIELYARKYRAQAFERVHNIYDNEPLSAVITRFSENITGFRFEALKHNLIDFLLWYKYARFDTHPTKSNLKLNVNYCNYAAEKIFKNDFPLLVSKMEGHEGLEGLDESYFNKEIDEEFKRINSFCELEKAHPTELNEYIDMFKYENYFNIFDFDSVEVYDREDPKTSIKNFEMIFDAFESLILNIYFSQCNKNTWGENGFVNILKIACSIEHYFDLFEKFQVGEWFTSIQDDILRKLTELLILQTYLNTYGNGCNFREDLKEFLDTYKFYILQAVKRWFEKLDDSNESDDSDE